MFTSYMRPGGTMFGHSQFVLSMILNVLFCECLCVLCGLALVSFSFFSMLHAVVCPEMLHVRWLAAQKKIKQVSLRTQIHSSKKPAGVLNVSWESSQFQKTFGGFRSNAVWLCDVYSGRLHVSETEEGHKKKDK